MLIKFWQSISKTGIKYTSNVLLQRRIILCNQISALAILVLTPVIISDIYFVLPHTYFYFAEVYFLFGFFITIILNSFGYYNLSRFWLMLNFLFGINIIGTALSDKSPENIFSGQLVTFSLMSFPLLLFDKKQIFFISLSIGLIFTFFFLAEPLKAVLSLGIPIEEDIRYFGNHYGFPLLAFAILVSTLLVSRSLDVGIVMKLLKETQQQNTKLEEQTAELEELNENLEDKVEERTAELQATTKELRTAYGHITDSVHYAKRIQDAVLGDIDKITNRTNSFVFFKPRDIVSGDFYWYSETRESAGENIKGLKYADMPQAISLYKVKVIIAADATGHGIPGAFMTIMGNDFLDDIINIQHVTQPDEILYQLDKKIISTLSNQKGESISDGMDLSIIVLDEDKGELRFAGAKNSLWYVRNGEMHEVKGSKNSIGASVLVKEKIFEKHVLEIKDGDTFYIFSDGFQDQFGEKENKKYMRKKFRNFLHSISHLSLKEQEKALDRELTSWKGNLSQTDDILVIGVRC